MSRDSSSSCSISSSASSSSSSSSTHHRRQRKRRSKCLPPCIVKRRCHTKKIKCGSKKRPCRIPCDSKTPGQCNGGDGKRTECRTEFCYCASIVLPECTTLKCNKGSVLVCAKNLQCVVTPCTFILENQPIENPCGGGEVILCNASVVLNKVRVIGCLNLHVSIPLRLEKCIEGCESGCQPAAGRTLCLPIDTVVCITCREIDCHCAFPAGFIECCSTPSVTVSRNECGENIAIVRGSVTLRQCAT